MELYIARHDETEFNAQRRYQGGGQDSPLTANGRTQAKALGETLAGIEFDAVYSSPLKRAVDTVEIAFEGRYKPILDSRLVEIGMGVVEGMYWEEVEAAYPDCRIFDPVNHVPPPQGENLVDMIARIGSFMDDISKAGHQKVFVLAHGYVLRVFEACVMDRTVEAIAKARAYGNCEVARYMVKDGVWAGKGS